MFKHSSFFSAIRCAAPAIAMAACAFISLSLPARADVIWNFTYSGTFPNFGPHYDQPDSVAGQLTTTDLNTANNTYTITGITGTDNGSPITGLLSEVYTDNLLFAAAPYLDFNGFAFSDTAGDNVNLYYNAGHYWDWFDQGATLVTNGAFTVSPTTAPAPEPASLALLGAGLLLFAAIGRKRRRIPQRERIARALEGN